MDTLLRDLRFGARTLWRQPGYALVAIVTLALALGANTVIFSFANILAIRPLPIADAGRLGWIYGTHSRSGNTKSPVSFPDYAAWRDGTRAFSSLAATTSSTCTLTGRGDPERLRAQRATGNIFVTWGLAPAAGRLFGPSDDRPGAPRVVVLAHRFWVQRFGASRSMIGDALTLDGENYTVVGVLTPAIEIGNLSLFDIWMPLAIEPAGARRDERQFQVSGRLATGATLAGANSEVTTIATRLQREHPDTNAGWNARVLSTRDAIVGPDTWLILGLLLTVVGIVLLIACANIASLVLARQTSRQREIALRAALGASRSRLVRQLVTEGLLVAAAGGVLGLGVAYAGMQAMKAFAYEPFFELVTIDRNVLAFGVVLSLAALLLFSLLPAFQASRGGAEALKEGDRSAGSRRGGRRRDILVAAQLAMALVLLVAAGLVVRTMVAVNRLDPGFRPEGLLTANVDLPERRYAADDRLPGQIDELLSSIARAPGVASAAAITRLPLVQRETLVKFSIEGRPAPAPDQRPWGAIDTCSAAYFEAAGIGILAGRGFSAHDTADTPRVAIVSRQAASRYWSRPEAALGQRVSIEGVAGEAPIEIVGLVGDTTNPRYTEPPSPHVYLPLTQHPQRAFWLVVRAGKPEVAALAVRASVRRFDPDLAVHKMRPMTTAIADELSSSRIMFSLFAAFAVLALTLAGTGLYGLMAYGVSQRRREIAIRMALGASRREIGALVLWRAARLTAAGMLIGMVGALGIARALSAVLFGVTATDPSTYVAVAGVLLAVALLAGVVPARRAANLDAAKGLKADA